MQIVYIADTNGHFSEVFSEYEKRLSSTVKCVRIRAVKHADPRYVAHHETLKAVEWLNKQKKKAIILDEFWRNYTTFAFAGKIRKMLDSWEEPVFLIGGSFWLERELLVPYMSETLALSEFTLPHSLALIVLMEQLYRIHEIWKGSKYHHQ